MIQYFLSEPIKMHPKKGEETEMTLLPIFVLCLAKLFVFLLDAEKRTLIIQMHI